MPRFYNDTADNYGNYERTSFFSLPNDKDTARIRFMYNNMDDVFGYAVHEVEVGDKRKQVNCLREYTDPKDVCPFCAAGIPVKAKVYVPLYDVKEETVKIWERGKKYLGTLSSICSRYASADKPLVSQVFEIERNGKKGDPATTYREYPIDRDNTTLKDLPEVPDVLGSLVLDKTAEEMSYFVTHREFPNGSAGDSRREPEREEFPRRTPSRRDVRDEDNVF